MNAQEIRTAYLKFFEERGHKQIPRAPLLPDADTTTLFTGSGMQALLPFLLGEAHPEGKRLTDSQTCLRAQDIEEVGDNRHTTFFEMLGNWSLGDYFKVEQLPWVFEFLTDVVGLEPAKLYVTCFIGDQANSIPKDEDSAGIWKQLFLQKGVEAEEAAIGSEVDGALRGMRDHERIFYYDASKNWWCRGGEISDMPEGEPGGPDSEVFYDFGTPHDEKFGKYCHPNCDCGRFLEIGNSVFMEYVRTADGFEKLPKRNVDFGGGLERVAAAKLGDPDVFKISILKPIVAKLEEISGKTYESHTESMRVIADHLRAATFLAVDGVSPSNKEQGYVMRRLVRRAVRQAFDLGVEQNFLEQVVPVVANIYHDDYPEVAESRQRVIETLIKEEKVFRQTLRKGIKILDQLAKSETRAGWVNSAEEMKVVKKSGSLGGLELFLLYDTYGFPIELSKEEAYKKGYEIEDDADSDFAKCMQEQRQRSKTAAKGEFKGGLEGQSDIHKKYHTATHLMYQALRDVLGDHVVQHGSNITEERLRFDFSHPEKVTPEQITEIEKIVNQQIENDLKVTWEEHPTDYARNELHVLGAFGDRYGDTVKCYRMQAEGEDKPFSFEICGGPHVDHTAQLKEGGKKFKITKEESSSAGIRRVKAVLK